jgi:glycosyltransferase involved in cell wall biosynthesis
MNQALKLRPDRPESHSEEPSPPYLSVIVPIYNEEESIPTLCQSLFAVLDTCGRSFEIICVNDCSTDRSLEILRAHAAERNELRVVSFRRNYGQTAATMGGNRLRARPGHRLDRRRPAE